MLFYWIFFIVYCLGHLVTCYLEKELPRKITKIFIVPLLFVGLALTKTFNLWLYIGLTLGWIGDVLLIFTGKKRYFVIGGASFLLGHFSYVCSSMALLMQKYDSFSDIPLWAFAILGVVAVVFLVLTITRIRKHVGVFAYLGAFYFYILITALITCILTERYLLSIGFAVFMISDSILSIARFAHPIKRDHFYIMSTYILAQTLICLSYIYA